MKYRRVVNQKLEDADSSDMPDDMVVAAPCWPEDGTLPRIVERNGEIVLDEGWVEIDDEDEPEPDAGV